MTDLKNFLLALRKPSGEPEPRAGHLTWKEEDLEHHAAEPEENAPETREGHLGWKHDDLEHHGVAPEIKESRTLAEKIGATYDTPKSMSIEKFWDRSKRDRLHDELSKTALGQRSEMKSLSQENIKGAITLYKLNSTNYNNLLRKPDETYERIKQWKGIGVTYTRTKKQKESAQRLHSQHVKRIGHLDTLTSTESPHSFTAYRGGYKEAVDHAKMPVGHTFTDHGFAGLSLDRSTAEHFADYDHEKKKNHIFSIHVPKGTKGHYLNAEKNSTAAHEREFLLRRGTTFRVKGHSYDEKNKVHITHVTVHHQHEPKKNPIIEELNERYSSYHDPIEYKDVGSYGVTRKGSKYSIHEKLAKEALEQRKVFHDKTTHMKYKGSSYGYNSALRNGNPFSNYQAKNYGLDALKDSFKALDFHKHVENMDKMTAHPTQHSFTAFRGGYKEATDHAKMPVGHTFTDHGFTGVSLSRDAARSFADSGEDRTHVFAVHVPKGTKGHYLDANDHYGHDHEREFVLRRGTTFRVRGHSYDPGTNTHFTHVTVHAQHEPREPIKEPDYEGIQNKAKENDHATGQRTWGMMMKKLYGESHEDASNWKPASGHTETHTFSGGFMHDGQKTWYVKEGHDDEHLRVEHLSNRLYRHMGIRTPETKLVHHEGKLKLASEKIEGARPVDPKKLPGHKDVHAGFAADAWLGSWDVAGVEHSNLLSDKHGNVHRIDQGGSLHRRAMGGVKSPKQWSSTSVDEMHSLRDPSMNQHTARMFSKMTDKDVHESISRVAKVSDRDIEHHAHEAFDGKPPQGLVETLKARRDHLASKINPDRERHMSWGEKDVEHHEYKSLQEKIAGDTYEQPHVLAQTLKHRLMFDSHFEGSRTVKKHFHHVEVAEQQAAKFTPDHMDSIRSYKSKSEKINDHLRGVDSKSYITPLSADEHKVRVKHLDQVTNHPAPSSFTVYRGIRGDHPYKHLPVGSTFTDHGYTSTSISRSEAHWFTSLREDEPINKKRHIFSIHVPKGTRGHYMDAHPSGMTSEKEFLLQRGTTFKVHGHSYDPVSHVHVTHVVAHSQKRKPVDYTNYNSEKRSFSKEET